MHRLALLILALGCCLAIQTVSARAADPSAAQEVNAPAPTAALQPGEMRFDFDAGYGGYAFPVANAELARQWTAVRGGQAENWASRGLMAYQLAYDYSVVPVHVFIEHRMPTAFSGAVEVSCAYGYSASEAPAGSPATVMRRDFTAPASVPMEFTLPVRCAPPSTPGAPVEMTVRVFQRGVAAPIKELTRTVIQLEPAHLYSLLLDGPPDMAPLADELNPGNRLQLAIPPRHEQELDPAIYSSMHYVLSCPRGAVTGLPLAARQFAFVLADYAAVQHWPAADQAALAAFMVGGGRLCLFHAPAATTTTWQGCALDKAATIGRGRLLPVAGDLAVARSAVRDWLEGELSEFTLWAGGTVAGRGLRMGTFTGFGSSELALSEVYGIPEVDAAAAALLPPLAHRSGFLHPLWVYREAADEAALEPWDYPEFTRFPVQPGKANQNLSRLTSLEHSPAPPAALATFAASVRGLPEWWLPGTLLLAILPGLLALTPQLRLVLRRGLLVATVAAAAAGAGAWALTGPNPQPVVGMTLFDADARCPQVCAREAVARFSTGDSGPQFDLPPDALLRRVDWQPPGAWRWDSTAQVSGAADGPGHWQGAPSTSGSYTVLRSDSVAAPTQWPLKVTVTQRTPTAVNLTIDSGNLPLGSALVLQTIVGWQALRASSTPQHLTLELPQLAVQPGAERLFTLSKLYANWGLIRGRNDVGVNPGDSDNLTLQRESSSLKLQLLAGRWPSNLPPRSSDRAGTGEQDRLGWTGILQDPQGGRGLPADCGVLYVELPPAANGAGTPAAAAQSGTASTAQRSWLRYSFPLNGPSGAAGAVPPAAGAAP